MKFTFGKTAASFLGIPSDPQEAIFQALYGILGEPRIIWDRGGANSYLIRWYILGKREKGTWREKLPFNIFLHEFRLSDDAGDLHSHPFQWSVALVLYGGYIEERRVGDRVETRRVTPPSINIIRGDDYHRVDLIKNSAWSLFIAGPHTEDDNWHFWDRITKRKAQWLDYVQSRREGREPLWR